MSFVSIPQLKKLAASYSASFSRASSAPKTFKGGLNFTEECRRGSSELCAQIFPTQIFAKKITKIYTYLDVPNILNGQLKFLSFCATNFERKVVFGVQLSPREIFGGISITIVNTKCLVRICLLYGIPWRGAEGSRILIYLLVRKNKKVL